MSSTLDTRRVLSASIKLLKSTQHTNIANALLLESLLNPVLQYKSQHGRKRIRMARSRKHLPNSNCFAFCPDTWLPSTAVVLESVYDIRLVIACLRSSSVLQTNQQFAAKPRAELLHR